MLGLVAQAQGQPFDRAGLEQRLAAREVAAPAAELGLGDTFAVLGSFVAGPKALGRFAGDAPANRDDHPVVAYRAPRATYAPEALPRDRLLALLDTLDLDPGELLAADTDAAWPARLAAYWRARDLYLLAGRTVRPSSDVNRMLAQVREPLLGVLRTSPDFRPAYDPLLQMATALSRSDDAQARALLSELAAVQPARPEAGQVLARLDGARP